MKYLSKKNNIVVFLTTHYIKVCTKLQNNPNIKNFHMNTKQTKDNIEFLYTLEPGISSIKGGKFILHSMNYPKEIVESSSSLSLAHSRNNRDSRDKDSKDSKDSKNSKDSKDKGRRRN